MRSVSVVVAVIGLATLANGKAIGQTVGDPAAGRAFALEECASCHRVAPDQGSSPKAAAAPDFQAIAHAPGATEMSLRAFLSTPHPRMPNLILSRQEQDDVIAYILSLRGEH